MLMTLRLLAVVLMLHGSGAALAQCIGTTDRSASGSGDWTSWGGDAHNTRYRSAAAAGVSAANVSRLELAWAYNLGPITDARGQPILAGSTLYVGTPAGDVFALDAESGCLRWRFHADGGVHAAVAVAHDVVIVADQKANAYALDAATGALRWRVHLDDHITARVTGSPQIADGVAYIPLSSFEEVMALAPKYECCTFRGSVVALDVASGRQRWKTYTVPDSPRPTTVAPSGVQRRGPSGAAIWSSPTIDAARGVLYVATGNNYSDPATSTSDAVIAMNLSNGAIRWTKQLTTNDAENVGCDIPGKPVCPTADGPDADFGQPPILTRTPSGRPLLVVAQKSGMAYALDPQKRGEIVWQTRVGKGGRLGGSQWGSASDGRYAYVATSDLQLRTIPDSTPQGFHLEPDPTHGGGLTAIDLATGRVHWTAPPVLACGTRKRCAPSQSAAVTAIDGVAFSAAVDGHLRAYAAMDGKVMWDFDAIRSFETVNGPPAHGGSFDGNGVAIGRGMLFVTSGYGLWGGTPGNVLLAFSVRGHDH